MTDHSHPSAASRQTPNGDAGTDIAALETVYRWVISDPRPLGLDVCNAVETIYGLAERLASRSADAVSTPGEDIRNAVGTMYRQSMEDRFAFSGEREVWARAQMAAYEHVLRLLAARLSSVGASEPATPPAADAGGRPIPHVAAMQRAVFPEAGLLPPEARRDYGAAVDALYSAAPLAPSEAGGREPEPYAIEVGAARLRMKQNPATVPTAEYVSNLLSVMQEEIRRLRASRPSSGEDSARDRKDAERWRSLQPSLEGLRYQIDIACGDGQPLTAALTGQKSDATFYTEWERLKERLREMLAVLDRAARAAEGSA